MNNYDILKYCQFVANKEQVGNTLSIVEFNELLDVCSVKLLRLKLGIPVMPDELPQKQQFEKNQSNTDSIAPFKVYKGLNGTDPLYISTGIALIPSDYFYHSAALYKQYVNKPNCEPIIKNRKVEVVTDQQWDDVVSSTIRPPSEKYPIMNYQDGFIRFAPDSIRAVDYVYIKRPVKPVFDFYFNADGETVYLLPRTKHTLLVGEEGSAGQVAPATVVSQSVESEFNEADKVELANIILQHIGINLREGALLQYSEMIKKEGI